MILTLPPSIRAHFAVVPPISRTRTFGSSISRPSSAAPQTPDAGPRLDHRDRNPGNGFHGVDAAIRLHHVKAAAKPPAFEAVPKTVKVTFRNRLDIGRQHRRVAPFVFTPFPGDPVRGNRGHTRPERSHGCFRRAFVFRIGIGMQKADRDRLNALSPEIADDVFKPGEVERRHLLASVVHSARQFAPQVPGHERSGLFVMEIEEVRPVAAGDFKRVAKPLCGDQADTNAPAFCQRIDDHCRPVHEEADSCRIRSGLFDDIQDSDIEIRRRRIRLCRPDGRQAGVFIGFEKHEVSKGSANIRRGSDRFSGQRFSLPLVNHSSCYGPVLDESAPGAIASTRSRPRPLQTTSQP